MKPTKKPIAPLNGAKATQTNDIDNSKYNPSGNGCQDPILFLDINLALDAVLDAEDLHDAAYSAFYSQWVRLTYETARVFDMLLAHRQARLKARAERAILERGIL